MVKGTSSTTFRLAARFRIGKSLRSIPKSLLTLPEKEKERVIRVRRKRHTTTIVLWILLAATVSLMPLSPLRAKPYALLALEKGAATPSPAPSSPPPQVQVKGLWDYRQELGLTEQQVDQIKAALSAYQKELITLRAKLRVSELEVKELLDKNADLNQVKAKLTESAAIQVEIRLADIQAARKIEGSLTTQQLARWREIQKEARSGKKPASEK